LQTQRRKRHRRRKRAAAEIYRHVSCDVTARKHWPMYTDVQLLMEMEADSGMRTRRRVGEESGTRHKRRAKRRKGRCIAELTSSSVAWNQVIAVSHLFSSPFPRLRPFLKENADLNVHICFSHVVCSDVAAGRVIRQKR
jgi:hypothetical protein